MLLLILLSRPGTWCSEDPPPLHPPVQDSGDAVFERKLAVLLKSQKEEPPWLVLAFLVFGRPLCLYATGQMPGECQVLETHPEARFYFNHLLSVQQKPRKTKELTAPGQRQNFAWKASSYFSVSSSSRMERGGMELWQRKVKWTENKGAREGKITMYFFFSP